jgi:hypothetical protein
MGLAAVAAVLMFCTGCWTMANGPVLAPIQASKGAMSIGDVGVKATKVGKAKAMGIILVGVGDASISAAMQSAGITKVHHVDTEQLNVLGIYCESYTVVYGE